VALTHSHRDIFRNPQHHLSTLKNNPIIMKKHVELTLLSCISRFLLHQLLTITSIILCHDYIIKFFPYPLQEEEEAPQSSPSSNSILTPITIFIAFYYSLLITARLVAPGSQSRKGNILEFSWCCNLVLFVSVICHPSILNRPVIPLAGCVAVSIDQGLWYVDVVGFLWSGKFPVGVAKYITWEEVALVKKITATHHLWTIPLVVIGYSSVVAFDWRCLLVSYFVIFFSVLFSRWLSPEYLLRRKVKSEEQDGKGGLADPQYLNINMCYSVWKDLSSALTWIEIDDPSALVFLSRQIPIWCFCNSFMYLLIWVAVYGKG